MKYHRFDSLTFVGFVGVLPISDVDLAHALASLAQLLSRLPLFQLLGGVVINSPPPSLGV